MMNDVEQETPGHGCCRPRGAEEIEVAIPAIGGNAVPALGHVLALLFVRFEHFFHGGGHGWRIPCRLSALQRIDDHLLLAYDLPGNLLCSTRFWIRAIVRSLGNSRQHLPGSS